MQWIFETLLFLTGCEIYSDGCGARELDKMEIDYKKDVIAGKKKTKSRIWRYIKEDQRKESDDEDDEPRTDEPSNKEAGQAETTISQNTKMSVKVIEGFAE